MGDLPARLTPQARPDEVATESAAPRTAADLALDRFFERDYRWRPVQATYTGIHTHDTRLPDWSPSGLEGATAELLQWAETRGLLWDMNDSPAGERWGCRLEIYHSDPREQPDMNAWRTELAFRLADGAIPN